MTYPVQDLTLTGSCLSHINIQYFFVTNRIADNELNVEWCPTGQMITDYMTKPVQGALVKQFRDQIMGVDRASLPSDMVPLVLGPQECVGDISNIGNLLAI
jgi:hypothetical protein